MSIEHPCRIILLAGVAAGLAACASEQAVAPPAPAADAGPSEGVVFSGAGGSRPAQRSEALPHDAMRVGLFGEMHATDQAPPGDDGARNLAQVSFSLEGADFDPDVDPTGTFVVYASTRDHATSDIYRKRIHGGTVTLLTTDPADDMMPSISPDGKRIAFASTRSGNWDIYVMPIEGGQPIQVTTDESPEIHPTWSPDGHHIAFNRRGATSDRWEIWVTDADQPAVQDFIAYGLFPRWSPDPAQSRILFQRPRETGSRLYGVWTIDLRDGEGVNPTEIISASNAATMHPAWAPDGRRIAFVTVLNPGGVDEWPQRAEIWSVNVDGTGRTLLTSGAFRNLQPTWGTDGRVYFVSNRGGSDNIWCVNAGQGRLESEPGEDGSMDPKSMAEGSSEE